MVSEIAQEYAEIGSRRTLIDHMARGQLRASLHRTALGMIWYLLIPAIQICIYYVLVVVIFSRGGAGYFVTLAMGILHYSILQQALSGAASSIHGSAPMLLQIKIEPLVLVAAAFVKALRTSLVGIPIFLLLYFTTDPVVGPRLLAYPVILVLWLWFCWSASMLVATAGVYSRDLLKVLPFATQILMYMSPVIYSVSFFPNRLYGLFLLNPIAAIFALLQWCFVDAAFPPLHAVLLLPVTLSLVFFGAHRVFSRGRRNFTKAF